MPNPRDLPIYGVEDALVTALEKHGRAVVEAPTGSGKSTQVPQMLLDRGVVPEGKEVVVLEPRRIAARMLARRVAGERGGKVGGEIGYVVRFERQVSRETRVRFVTEGVLLREMQDDPELSRIGAVVFDEFHERHLHGDISLARVLGLVEGARPDLKAVVMSATLDTGGLQEYLGGEGLCPLVRCEGRTFPVTVKFAPPRAGVDRTLPEQVARAVKEAVSGGAEAAGDVLVFLPGTYEIKKTVGLIEQKGWAPGYDVLPLYGELPPAAQDAAVRDGGRPKVVVATNVAETSLTIPGVRTVIDSGLARAAAYDANRGINTLTIQKISKAAAEQRAGRAGRVAPGTAIRLWNERDHAARRDRELAEVRRMDLAEVVLTLKLAGVHDIRAFRWLEPPEENALTRALDLLVQLGAIESHDGEPTEIGRTMARFPLHPRESRVLVEAAGCGCLYEAVIAVAMLQGRPLFRRNQKGDRKGAGAFGDRDDDSDFRAKIRAYQFAEGKRFDLRACDEYGVNAGAAREASALVRQIERLCDRSGLAGESAHPDLLPRALLAGFPDHVAVRTAKGSAAFDLTGGRRGRAAEDSLVKNAQLVVAAEIAEVEGREVRTLLNDLSEIQEVWLQEIFPGSFHETSEPEWDSTQRRVVARTARCFQDLVLESRERGEPDRDKAAAILGERVAAGELVLKKWDHSVDQWIARVNCLAEWMPELEIPPVTEEDRAFLMAEVCAGAKSYKEIKERSPWPALKSWLSEMQRSSLESYAPERVTFSNGRDAKVTYTEGQAPKAKMILQRLYDVNENPTVAGGNVVVVVELLTPAQRPAQTTGDLGTFWKTSYEGVKKELKGRYPKHEWR